MAVKLDVAEFVRDYVSGLKDKELLEKHGLTARQMVRVVKKLMDDGVITREHYEVRNKRIGEQEIRQERDFLKSLHHCPVCDHIQPMPFNRCPACGTKVKSVSSQALAGPPSTVPDLDDVPDFPDEMPVAAPALKEEEEPESVEREEAAPAAPMPAPKPAPAPPPSRPSRPAPRLVQPVAAAPEGAGGAVDLHREEPPDELKEFIGVDLEEKTIFPGIAARFYQGDYRIAEVVASGSKWRVFRAECTAGDGRPLAVRLLQPDVADDDRDDEVLDRIVKVQSNMEDDNLVRLLGTALVEGERALLHEYLPITAGSILESEPDGLPVKQMLRLLPQILNGVGYAHMHRGSDQIVRRVPHLCLKLSKVLLYNDAETLKIGGFGVNGALAATRKKRTFLWEEPGVDLGRLAPECFVQTVRFVNQAQVDIYALGALLYELITGRTLFSCSDFEEYKFAHLKRYPIPPRVYRYDIPLWLDAMILKCLKKDPDERWRSATQMELSIRD